MTKIYNEREININVAKDGFYPIKIDAAPMQNVHIIIDKGIDASLYIAYHGTAVQSDICINVEEDAKAVILFWDNLDEKFIGKHKISLGRNATAKLGYGMMNHDQNDIILHADLLEEGADIHLMNVCVSELYKHFHITCVHHVPHTTSFIENYCVVKEHGDYFMEANGVICKGAYGSESHQKTHVLTMSEKQKSEVIPILQIDENDVKASHATTMGQPDENQLYYMQSRGLNREQSIALLSAGYIMPITVFIDNVELQNSLKEDLEKKVGL